MPYNPSTDVYSLPAIYLAIPGTVIIAAQHNDPLEDLAVAQNYPRPVIAGGTGSTTPAGAAIELEVISTTGASQTISYSDNGAAAGPILKLHRISTTPTAGDLIGRWEFSGRDLLPGDQVYGAVDVQIDDATSTNEDSTIRLRGVTAGTEVTRLALASDAGTIGGISTSPYQLGREVNDQGLALYGGTVAAGDSARLTLYGGTTAGVAGDYLFSSNGLTKYYFDLSATLHDFTGNIRNNGSLEFGTNLVQGIYGDTAGSLGLLYSSSTGPIAIAAQASHKWNRSEANNNNLAIFTFFRNGVSPGSITATNTTTTYNTSSDYRLKTNVAEIDDAWEKVKALRPVSFEWNINPEAGRVIGFIAHEVQEIVPEAVTGEKDGEEMQGMDAAKLLPLAFAVIKELQARVEALENA